MKDIAITLNKFIEDCSFGDILLAIAEAGKTIMIGLSTMEIPEEFKNRIKDSLSKTEKFDEFAHSEIEQTLHSKANNKIAYLISEERQRAIEINGSEGKYVLAIDPLDGSNNMDTGLSVGTIFSIWCLDKLQKEGENLLFRSGRDQIAAGYFLYGTSTSLILAMNNKVSSFLLKRNKNGNYEFLLVKDYLKCPEKGYIYSVNEGNYKHWSKRQRAVVDWFKTLDQKTGGPFTSRYVGTFVADFHRTLLKGGIYMYPVDESSPKGKLRYLYEIAPLAYICEAAGGMASDGTAPSLDHNPDNLHEKCPVYMGSTMDVKQAISLLAAKNLNT